MLGTASMKVHRYSMGDKMAPPRREAINSIRCRTLNLVTEDNILSLYSVLLVSLSPMVLFTRFSKITRSLWTVLRDYCPHFFCPLTTYTPN